MAIVGVDLETLVSEPDALTTRPPPCEELNLTLVQLSEWLPDFRAMNIA